MPWPKPWRKQGSPCTALPSARFREAESPTNSSSASEFPQPTSSVPCASSKRWPCSTARLQILQRRFLIGAQNLQDFDVCVRACDGSVGLDSSHFRASLTNH